MAKLSDADVKRFVTALEHGETFESDAAKSAEIAGHALEPEQPAAPSLDVTIGQAIEQALHSYLGSDLQNAIPDKACNPAQPMWFESALPERWLLGLDAPLVALLADLAIGGDGKAARPPRGARVGALLEPVAQRMITAAASAVGSPAPASVRAVAELARTPQPLANGAISNGAATGAWSIAREKAAAAENPARELTPLVEIVHTTPRQTDIRPAASGPRERILAARQGTDASGALSRAVAAASAQLREITHRAAEVETVRVTLVESPTLPREDLKLALIAGGQGSLVLSADRAAIAVVAEAVTGEHADGQEPGAIIVDAVETVLRAAMRGFAESLPGLARGPQRFVRLAESAMPARSPHYVVVAPVRLERGTATLAWLVPTWMADLGEVRAPE